MNSEATIAAFGSMRRIVAVTIDLWDTLVQEVPGGSRRVAEARIAKIEEILARSGIAHSIDELEAAYEKTGAFLELTWSKRRDMTTRDQVLFMLSCLDDKLAGKLEKGVLADVEAAYAEGILVNPPIMLPGAREAVRSIKEHGYRLGLISNTGRTPGSMLRKVMGDMGIAEPFDTMTFSNEVLVRKPAESAFRLTLERLGSIPKASVHVGDDPDADVAGAQGVGMHAIQIVRKGARRAPRADACIESLIEVADRIDGL